ncbi:MAG: DHA2 family efflux MFS transporter permease subunit, partial [Candidatus Dormibacteraeota bacterium]|nr:DHA2 family efflux MFS transporter permease subunit [Candidatus Dormibacteraeota bacterium]
TVIPLSAWASDRFGAKRVYAVAIALFIVGSAATGLAWSTASLITFRVLQGLGGGMIMPAGMTILARAAGPRRLGRIMSVIGIPMLLGPILGPILGGFLVDQVSWRWIFYINVPIGVVAVILAAIVLPREGRVRGEAGRLDLVGVLLLSPGLAAFVYGLAQSSSHGGFSDPHAWVPAAAGLVLIAGFTAHALTDRNPLLDLRLFGDPAVGATGLVMVIFMIGAMGSMLLVPLYFQLVRGGSALQSGLLLAPQGIGAMIAMQLGGRLTDRIGASRVIAPGLVLAWAGLLAFAMLTAHTSYVLLCADLFVSGIGIGMVMMPSMTAVMTFVPPEAISRASTALNIIQQAAISVGTAVFSIILTQELTAQLGGKVGSGGALAAARSIPPALRGTVEPLIATAFAHTFVWALAVITLAFVPGLYLFVVSFRGHIRSAEEEAQESVA